MYGSEITMLFKKKKTSLVFVQSIYTCFNSSFLDLTSLKMIYDFRNCKVAFFFYCYQ